MQQEKAPKVSVCVITYNQKKYIRQCLQSIVDQETDFDFEVIVGDDCSTDGTREIVQEFAGKYPSVIRTVFQENNTGGTKNYLDVHEATRGTYVAHCDGDDFFLPSKLQKQSDYFDAHDDCSVVYTRAKILNDSGESWENVTNLKKVLPENKFSICDVLCLGAIGIHSTQMYRRSSRKTRQPGFLVLDYFYSIEFLLSGYGYYFSDVLGAHRYTENVGGRVTLSSNQYENIKLIAKYQLYYAKKAPHLKRWILLGALTFFAIEAKNLRLSALIYARNIIRLLGPISLSDLYNNLQRARAFRIRCTGI